MEDESRRYTVSEAARVLGITEAAVRARINRGKLQSEKIDNSVYVRLDSDTTPVQSGDQSTLVEALRDQVAMLKQQLNTEQEASAELRRIIAALTSRIPELPPASSREPSESPETATDLPMGATPSEASEAPQEPTEGVSWWRRVFGG